MPELPEIETIKNGLLPVILNKKITGVQIYNHKMRWAVPYNLPTILQNQFIRSISRRAKYLLLGFDNGTLLVHLGMSGSFILVPGLHVLRDNQSYGVINQDPPKNDAWAYPLKKHDHVDIFVGDDLILRYNDPRRFGGFVWTNKNPFEHKLLVNLGPEPFCDDFNAKYLFDLAHKRSAPIKTFIMDSKVVVGVGNIYASEILFAARIDPLLAVNKLSLKDWQVIVAKTRAILQKAIASGGTSIKDYKNAHGKMGYFVQQLQVYGREGISCNICHMPICKTRLAGRATFYCARCQNFAPTVKGRKKQAPIKK